jgi:hypothetical protein
MPCSFRSPLLFRAGLFAALIASSLAARAEGPAIDLIAPNGGEVLKPEVPFEIRWQTRGPVTRVRFSLSTDGGASWTPIGLGYADNTGSYSWTPPTPPPRPGFSTPAFSPECLLRVIDADSGVMAESRDYFSNGFDPLPCIVTPVQGPGFAPVSVRFDVSGLDPNACQHQFPAYGEFGCYWDFGNRKWSFERSPTFTYSLGGTFTWTLRAYENALGTVPRGCAHRGTLDIPTVDTLLLQNGRVKVTASYVSQYTGLGNQGVPVAIGDQSGYFYFFDRDTPEVFIKVLDFAPDAPFNLFYASLTDFEVHISFTNVATGKSVTILKNQGFFLSGADKLSLQK